MDLKNAITIAASGMKVQGERIKIVSENLVNANTLPSNPGEDPYQRKTITFKNMFDKAMQTNLVKVDKIDNDKAEFGQKYEPYHPAADENGYVQTPNVNVFVEMMDIRDAQRSYEANLKIIEASRDMIESTINLLN